LEMEASQMICLGWPWTTIIPISVPQVARITDVSHWHLAQLYLYASFTHTQYTEMGYILKGLCFYTLYLSNGL
jgi:hypothetical protein